MSHINMIKDPDVFITNSLHFVGSDPIKAISELLVRVNKDYTIFTNDYGYYVLLSKLCPEHKIVFTQVMLNMRDVNEPLALLLYVCDDVDVSKLHATNSYQWTVAKHGVKHKTLSLPVMTVHCHGGKVHGITYPSKAEVIS